MAASGEEVPPPDEPDYSFLDNIHTCIDGLRYWAGKTPDTAAFIFRAPNGTDREVLTYSDLYGLAGRWAAVLHRKDVGRGNLVVNTLPNSPERAVVESSILMSGAASVNGMCQLSDASDLKAVLRQSAAQALVFDPDVMPDAYRALLKDVTEPAEDGAVTSDAFLSLKYVFLIRRRRQAQKSDENEREADGDFLTALRYSDGAESYHNQETKDEDIVTVFTTSGSTGFSKLVTYTHKTLLTIGKSMKRRPNIEFINSPMGWAGGYLVNLLLYGSTRVLCDARAGTPPDMVSFICNSIKEEAVSMAFVPLPLLESLVDMAERMNSSGKLLQVISLGTQAITRQLVVAALKLAQWIVVVYGSTEVMFVAFSALNASENYTKDYCAGTVLSGMEVKLLDKDGHDIQEKETRGEIVIKSSTKSFRDYLNDPQATAAAHTEDGFFQTRDVGWFGSGGQLYVEGRNSDAITRGSYIFYPGWLESRIRACPGVRDVVIVGVPDAALVNELCACLVLKSSEKVCLDDVKKFVDNDITTDDDDAMSPKPRYYLVFESFPMTASGKLKRSDVSKLAAERLGKGQ